MTKGKPNINGERYCKADFPCEYKHKKRSYYLRENQTRPYFVLCRWQDKCNQQTMERQTVEL